MTYALLLWRLLQVGKGLVIGIIGVPRVIGTGMQQAQLFVFEYENMAQITSLHATAYTANLKPYSMLREMF
jgi:hypothetical protein